LYGDIFLRWMVIKSGFTFFDVIDIAGTIGVIKVWSLFINIIKYKG
jgi:hypothetical protein